MNSEVSDSPISGYLKRVRGGVSQADFAEKIGVHKNTLVNYESGKRMPDVDFLVDFSNATGADLAELLRLRIESGEHQPRDRTVLEALSDLGIINHSMGSGKTRSTEELLQLADARGKQTVLMVQDRQPDAVAPIAPDGFILVPRYDVAASMGNGAVIHSEQVVDHLAFRAEWVRTELGTSPRNLILISAIGDSMEPSLRAGDLLLIDRSVESVKQDSIYAIAHDGELRIKRIQRLFDGSLVIKSDNPSYRTEELSPAQAEQMRIVGRVVWSGRRM